MQCPVDGTILGLVERFGVEVDYCPDCRGEWLDRGELDRIIERAVAQQSPLQRRPDRSGDVGSGDGHGERKKGGRLSILTDLLGGGE